jgi:hypothetical protein
LVEQKKDDNGSPVLAPFQLAGPMEIWIQDAKDMRISLPVCDSFRFYSSSFGLFSTAGIC